jgi:transcriptional regulator with XRE-family HTH domain
MTATPVTESVPTWDLADRLRKALRVGDIGVDQMARYLEVSRQTVGRWINGHNNPSPPALRMWAMLTGVDYEWLRDGDTDLVRRQGLEPRTRWLMACPPIPGQLSDRLQLSAA